MSGGDIWQLLGGVLDDVVRHPEVLQGSCVTHIASERIGPRSLRAEVALLPVVASTSTWVMHAVLGLRPHVPPTGLMVLLGLRLPARMTQSNMGWDLGR
jgi:hypothetical protein